MDPFSLASLGLKAIVTVTKLLHDKTEQVEKLRKRESRSAHGYKVSVKELAAEAARIEALLDVTVHEGDPEVILKLFRNEDGNDAWMDLVAVLDVVRGFVAEQETAADKMLSILSKGKGRNRLTAVFGIDDEETRYDEMLVDTTAALEAQRNDIRRQFDHFKSLYNVIRDSSAPSPSRCASPSPGDDREKRRKACHADIVTSFYDRPFQLSVVNATSIDITADVDITKDNSSSSPSLIYTMQQMGRMWYEKHSDGPSKASVQILVELQVTVLKSLLKSIEYELASYGIQAAAGLGDNGSRSRKHLESMCLTMKKEIRRIESKHFSIAFCGMVKAGKSLFLNALTGRNLLPSDDLPATAWPCRLLHVQGLDEPLLSLDTKYFQSLIKKLQAKGYGKMMSTYKPPSNQDAYDAILCDSSDDNMSKGSDANIQREFEKREIYASWIDLHPKTKDNLLRLEQLNFTLASEAKGDINIIDLLQLVNDIIRLCGRFNIEIDEPTTRKETWPLLQVEFKSLRNEVAEPGIALEFIDLPGVGESGGEFHEFQDLVRDVAKEVDAVVPVVSFKEIPRDSWRSQLPEILQTSLERPPDFVLCTHLDHAKESLENLVADVAKTFYPKLHSKDGRNQVMACATREGIGAQLLMEMSERKKPKFKDFWIKDSILYDCAVKVLGGWDSEMRYEELGIGVWKRELANRLTTSKLQSSIRRLVKDSMVRSHMRVLGDEILVISAQLSMAIEDQHNLLLRMHRSREDYTKARVRFLEDCSTYHTILKGWEVERTKAQLHFNRKLEKGFELKESEIKESADTILRSKLDEFESFGRLQVELVDNGPRLTFLKTFDAEFFLQEVQKEMVAELNEQKKKLVEFVRTLASKAYAWFFESLRKKITNHSIDDKIQAALKDIILAELEENTGNTEGMAFTIIREKVMHAMAVKHTGSTAYYAIQKTVARPFLKQDPVDAFLNSADTRDDSTRLGDLGFMIRAPIVAVTCVSWLLGSGIWPFIKQSDKIIMYRDEIAEQLRKELLSKVSEDLQEEGRRTLKATMDSSWNAAKSIVETELQYEEARFDVEGKFKDESVSETKLAASLALLLNFVAAKSALSKLHADLRGIQM